jgi:hypothetical protein
LVKGLVQADWDKQSSKGLVQAEDWDKESVKGLVQADWNKQSAKGLVQGKGSWCAR